MESRLRISPLVLVVIALAVVVVSMAGGAAAWRRWCGAGRAPRVSVIVLSHARPHNLARSLPALASYAQVDEILVAHGNPRFAHEVPCRKARHLHDYARNEVYGAARRVFYAPLCRNDTVLFLDDDVYPTRRMLRAMCAASAAHPTRHVGVVNRTCTPKGYSSEAGSPHHVAITRTGIMCRKSVVEAYLREATGFRKYEPWLRAHRGNGEDLALNLFVQEHYGTRPVHVPEASVELDEEAGYSSRADHRAVRGAFCARYAPPLPRAAPP